MKFIKNLFLKFKYPYLRFINSDLNIGIYNREGVDIFLLNFLYNLFKNSDNNLIIEFSKPEESNISILNIFLDLFSDTKAIIFDLENKTVCSNILMDSIFHLKLKDKVSNLITSEHQNSFNNYQFRDINSDIISHLNNIDINFIGIYFDNDIYSNLNYCQKSNVFSIMVYNSKIYDKRSNDLRNYLLSLGYVYHSRLNNKHDFFILSECINGFPSSAFETIGLSMLSKWVCTPPNSNYTFPE